MRPPMVMTSAEGFKVRFKVPDVCVVVDVDLVELLRQQVIVQSAHVSDHLQGNKARQDGHD